MKCEVGEYALPELLINGKVGIEDIIYVGESFKSCSFSSVSVVEVFRGLWVSEGLRTILVGLKLLYLVMFDKVGGKL